VSSCSIEFLLSFVMVFASVRIIKHVIGVHHVELLVADTCNIIYDWSTFLLVGLLKFKNLEVLLVLDSALPEFDSSIIKRHQHRSNRVN
jgi:hypothetical protein